MTAVTGEDAEAIERSLERKMGAGLPAVRAAMVRLAKSMSADELGERAYGLYEKFRPSVPEGQKGWGAKGELRIAAIAQSGKAESGKAGKAGTAGKAMATAKGKGKGKGKATGTAKATRKPKKASTS